MIYYQISEHIKHQKSNILLIRFAETNKWREIIFKIKLTEEEYKLLMKEKSKNVMNI
jgi:hypothetical protein